MARRQEGRNLRRSTSKRCLSKIILLFAFDDGDEFNQWVEKD